MDVSSQEVRRLPRFKRTMRGRSLARFLGFGPGEETPDHSTLTRARNRLPLEIRQLAFELVLGLCHEKGLLKGKTLGVDADELEANALMISILRHDSGDDWQEYVRKLYDAETGVSQTDDEELRRFDKKRTDKKVSNDDWVNPHDPDARIGKIKNGRTHLKYKVEHAVDLETDVIVAAEVYEGTAGDCQTIQDTVNAARTNLREAGTDCDVDEVAADNDYRSEESLDRLQNEPHVRTNIPQPKRPKSREPKRKLPRRQAGYRRNRRNARGRRVTPKQFGDLQAALSAAFRLSRFAYFVVRSRRPIGCAAFAARLAFLVPRRSANYCTLKFSRTGNSTAC